MYVGACQQVCDVTINHAWMQYSVLGYSGTNSGGAVVIENSEFDHNQDGFDTNTQIGADPPAPQNGACPDNGISPITHTHSCWVFMHNNVHDNNNPNAPKSGTASNGPLGTGMTVSGGSNDTVMDNTFSNNGAWGILFVPFPDSDKPTWVRPAAVPAGPRWPGSAAFTRPTATPCCATRSATTAFSETRRTPTSGRSFSPPASRGTATRRNTAPDRQLTGRTWKQTQPTCDGTQPRRPVPAIC